MSKGIAIFLVVCALSFRCLSSAQDQQPESKGIQTDSRYLDRLDGPVFKDSLSFVFANECPVAHPEKPAICECGPNKVKKQAECVSCYKASGQKCGGPYCQSCTVVCDPRGVVPVPRCN